MAAVFSMASAGEQGFGRGQEAGVISEQTEINCFLLFMTLD
jgi:hypothetical protein